MDIKKPDQNISESIRSSDTVHKKDDGAPGDAPTPLEVPPAIDDSSRPNHNTGDSTPTWKKVIEIVAVMTGIGLLAINIFQLRATRKAADAAKIAANTAATQLELNERPWVTVAITFVEPTHAHSPGPSLTFNSDGTASLNAFVVVKNIGHSIAKDISIGPRMYPPLFDRILTEPIEKQKSWCDKVRVENPVEGFLPSIFPGEEDFENFTFGMSREDIEVFKRSEIFSKIHAIIPIVYGCVTYKSNISKNIYQTPFLYEMESVPIVLGTIPASKLAIFRLFRGMEAN